MYITYKKPCYFHQIPNWKVRTLGLFPFLRCWGSPLPPVCITPGKSAPPALQNAKSCTKLPGQLEEHCRVMHCRVIRVTPSMPPEPLLSPAGSCRGSRHAGKAAASCRVHRDKCCQPQSCNPRKWTPGKLHF